MTNEVERIKGRIKALIRERGLSENELAGEDKSLQKRLNSQISHNTKLTVETLLFILDQFPDVSAEYLLYGREAQAMENVVQGDHNIANNNNSTINGMDVIRSLTNQLAEKDKQIGQLLQLVSQQKVG